MIRSSTLIALLAASLGVACGSASDPGGWNPSQTTPTESTPLPNARRPFPADNAWNTVIAGASVDPKSSTLLASCGLGNLHPDFGTTYGGAPNGIPYVLVHAGQQKVPVTFDYADESDPGPYPIPGDALIEGANSDGDRHVLVVDKDNCKLYETGNSYPNGDGTWNASGGATWNLTSNAMRAQGWTSSDAAGLPILPGLVRYDEVASGSVNHVIRVTMPSTGSTYVWPASHKAKSGSSTLPMGSWIRLKSTADLSKLDPAVRPIAVALQRYGGVVADNGSAFYMSGAPDERWDNDKLQTLGTIKGSDFEVVNASGLMVASSSYQNRNG
jgi:hypothetical protein